MSAGSLSSRISVQAGAFDVGAETDWLQSCSKETGAITTFVGTVRDINEGDSVTGLHLEHYPGMTERQIEEIVTEAAGRWHVIAATVIHRIGDLAPGDQIVFVGVSSRHRGDAFDACEFIIDYLKTRATFWKKEQSASGDRWLETRQSDIDTANTYDDSTG